MPNAPEDRSYRAVLFTNLDPPLAPLVGAWVGAGHRWAAIVAERPYRSRLRRARRYAYYAPRWSWTASLKKHAPDAAFLWLDDESGWDVLGDRLKEIGADVAVSAFFMTKVPDRILKLFPLGGVNLHPAMLPGLPGPQPIGHMVAMGAHERYGGVTLHVMDDRFDQGPVIAFARLAPGAWRNPNSLLTALSGAMRDLAATALPEWCAGRREAKRQDEKNARWAGIVPHGFEVGPDWTIERLRLAAKFMGRRPGLFVRDGERRYSLGQRIVRLGPATGKPPRVSRRAVQFDLSDGRVAAKPRSRVRRFLHRGVGAIGWLLGRPAPAASVE